MMSDAIPITACGERVTVMARAPRFPNKFEFWSTDEQLAGLELLTSDELTSKAFHLRQALALYLRTAGIHIARPAPNGQHHPTGAGQQGAFP
jgi:hypothetical protein